MTTADPTTPPRRRRLLLWLLLGWLAWLIGANALLLSGQAERWANRRPERVQIHVGRAWTILPLLIHLREVTVDGHTRQRSYRVTVERAAGLWFLPTMAISFSFFLFSSGNSETLSGEPPELEIAITTSSAVIMPRSP